MEVSQVKNSTLYTRQFTVDSYSSIRAIGSKDNYPTSEGIYGVEVGTEIVKDGISSVCIYDAGSQQDWGSSEYDSYHAVWNQNFSNGNQDYAIKYFHDRRARLCFYM